MLRKVTIENFLSFREPTTFDIGDRSVFVGENNSGKTNVFRAIVFVLQNWGTPRQRWDDKLNDRTLDAKVEMHLTLSDQDSKFLSTAFGLQWSNVPEALTDQGEAAFKKLTIGVTTSDDDQGSCTRYWKFAFGDGDASWRYDNPGVGLIIPGQADGVRLETKHRFGKQISRHELSVIEDVVDRFQETLSSGEAARISFEDEMPLQKIRDGGLDPQKLQMIFDIFMRHILFTRIKVLESDRGIIRTQEKRGTAGPGFSFVDHTDVDYLLSTWTSSAPRVVARLNDLFGRIFQNTAVSLRRERQVRQDDGSIAAYELVTFFLEESSYSRSDAADGMNDALLILRLLVDANVQTILLDEPAKSFHDQYMRRLVKIVNDISGKAIVIITHNEQMLLSLPRLENVFCFHRVENATKVVPFRYPPDMNDASFEKFVKDPLRVKVFFASHVLFVEGETDYRFFEALKARDVVGILNSWTIVHMSGAANWKRASFLAKALGLDQRSLILLDRDTMCHTSKKVSRRQVEQYESWDVAYARIREVDEKPMLHAYFSAAYENLSQSQWELHIVIFRQSHFQDGHVPLYVWHDLSDEAQSLGMACDGVERGRDVESIAHVSKSGWQRLFSEDIGEIAERVYDAPTSPNGMMLHDLLRVMRIIMRRSKMLLELRSRA
uniref:AAA domain-containing protein n=1 Tax=Pinguiococcus pyrenoidosus TaxID=172671 RepID=A0A7R9UB39_9STRA|mmetsp:Transcript_3258/g.13045  ORF Transcript_3258/g.13045 Transcript_3258/m.13045 type:complete len:664 (+) Transcript_3258:111-2102(+)